MRRFAKSEFAILCMAYFLVDASEAAADAVSLSYTWTSCSVLADAARTRL